MEQKIYPSQINGAIQAPASKSVVQRVLAAGALCNGTSILRAFTSCDDNEAAKSIVKVLGATLKQNDRMLTVNGNYKGEQADELIKLHCGESGLSSRLFAPLSLLFSDNIELTGEGSLLLRPFTVMEKPFQQLGITFTSNNGFIPLYLKGQLKSGYIKLDGSSGSQFLTGLLMTLPVLNGDSVIEVENLQSKPYIDLTIEVLNDFGISVENKNYEQFTIKGNQHYKVCDYTIEGDWSGASCLLVAGAVAGSIEVTGVRADSQQADKAIVGVLKSAGALIEQTADSIKVSKKNLNAFEFDATHCPDLFPALVVLAANCAGISKIIGVNRLINKESNRALALQTEMANIGIKVEVNGNMMLVHGGKIKGGQTSSHNDHRIAMAMGVAGLTAQSTVNISQAESVNKSYPAFFDDLKSVMIN